MGCGAATGNANDRPPPPTSNHNSLFGGPIQEQYTAFMPALPKTKSKRALNRLTRVVEEEEDGPPSAPKTIFTNDLETATKEIPFLTEKQRKQRQFRSSPIIWKDPFHLKQEVVERRRLENEIRSSKEELPEAEEKYTAVERFQTPEPVVKKRRKLYQRSVLTKSSPSIFSAASVRYPKSKILFGVSHSPIPPKPQSALHDGEWTLPPPSSLYNPGSTPPPLATSPSPSAFHRPADKPKFASSSASKKPKTQKISTIVLDPLPPPPPPEPLSPDLSLEGRKFLRERTQKPEKQPARPHSAPRPRGVQPKKATLKKFEPQTPVARPYNPLPKRAADRVAQPAYDVEARFREWQLKQQEKKPTIL